MLASSNGASGGSAAEQPAAAAAASSTSTRRSAASAAAEAVQGRCQLRGEVLLGLDDGEDVRLAPGEVPVPLRLAGGGRGANVAGKRGAASNCPLLLALGMWKRRGGGRAPAIFARCSGLSACSTQLQLREGSTVDWGHNVEFFERRAITPHLQREVGEFAVVDCGGRSGGTQRRPGPSAPLQQPLPSRPLTDALHELLLVLGR